QLGAGRMAIAGGTHRQEAPAAFRRLHHALRLGRDERKRLLAEDMLAGVEGGDGRLGVREGRRRDNHRVDIPSGQQVVQTRHDVRNAVLLREGLRTLRQDVEDRHRPCRGVLGQRPHMAVGDPPGPDDADAKLVQALLPRVRGGHADTAVLPPSIDGGRPLVMSGTTNYGSSFLCPDARLGDSLSTAGVGCCRKAALHRGKSRQFVLSEATLRQDAATALPNFFAFLHEAPDILQATSGIALLLDLTGLRAINADGGTAAGDDHVGLLAAVLREITAASAPPAPRCYRLGGDEFLLFLPDADGGDAEWWTAHVNAALSALAHRRANGRSCPRVQGTAVPYPGPTGSVAELLASVYREVDTSRGSEANSIVPRLLNRIDETLSLLIEARLQAHTDVVSGLPNHRAAESALSAALKSPLTRNFSVLLVDGDDLRAYNALGYEAGNQMIRDLG